MNGEPKNPEPKDEEPKKEGLWTFLDKWGGPLVVLAMLISLGWHYWTGSKVSYWWIAIFMGAWFLYAFTNIFPREDWEKRTKGQGVVWERRSAMVSFSYVFAVFILLSPLWSRALFDQSQDQDEAKYAIALVRGCAEPSREDSDITPRRGDPKAAAKEDPDATARRIDLKSVPKEVRCETNTDQWLINIGGTIVNEAKPAALANPAAGEQRDDPKKKPDKIGVDVKPAAISTPVHIRGGLVVPLYFVIVALMGGAVSLLRRVPEIQRRSEHDYVGTEKEPKLSPGEVRERLGFQIIQFISAPLIAVAAYHAIGPESRTASVALGFTSGFASESILLMIRGVVEGIKPQSVTQQAAKGTVSGTVVAHATKQPISNAELAIIGQPALKTKSDSNGLFVIHDIPVGERVIEATHNNQSAKVKVTINTGKTTVCRVELS
jgi:hypothetical protein